MGLTVRDTILYVSEPRSNLPFRVCHPRTKAKERPLPNGEVTVRKISPEEMEKLWIK